ncbi:MAG: hypothetical protein HZC45_05355 [Deltaproteobacteria bacterium]|nr:hypothetical protein [Deltaproteobacteria bacterium]
MKRIYSLIVVLLLVSPMFLAASCGKKAEETKPAETAAPAAPAAPAPEAAPAAPAPEAAPAKK